MTYNNKYASLASQPVLSLDRQKKNVLAFLTIENQRLEGRVVIVIISTTSAYKSSE